MPNLIDSGFIKLQRKILDWEWYNDISTKTLFIHLLLKCNFKDKKWRGNNIKKGQILTGRKILSDETGLSEQQIKTALKKLKSTNEITIKATNRFSIITLVNYSLYQDKKTDNNQLDNQPEEQQATNKQPTSNQQATTTKNEKNEKNENKKNKLTIQNEKDFNDLWEAYEPVSTSIGSKAKAKKKYQEYLKKYNHDQILEATKRYIDHCKKNNQKTKMCYGFFDDHLESYINTKKTTNKEDILKKINEIAEKKLFKSCQQLQSNDERVFLFLKDEDDEKALRSLPENKRTKIKAILGDMLTDKELSIQIANFHIN